MNVLPRDIESLRSATHYRDIEVRNLRTRARKLALDTYSLMPGAMSGLDRPRVHFIYLHYVFEDEQSNFRSLIESLLDQGHDFASHSEAVETVCRGDFTKPMISVSFDDGVSNCLHAAEVLHEFGISACFYLSSGLIKQQRTQRRMLMTASQYAKQPVEYMNWDDAERLVELGHEIGGHTYNHVNVAKLSECGINDEVHEDRRVLCQRLGRVDHFAWPFGRAMHFSERGRRGVFEAGYRTCASAIRGAHIAKADHPSFCIRRDNIVAGWPVRHNLYLMAKSSRSSGVETNQWPAWDRNS